MPFFIVTMVHPPGPDWETHLPSHVRFLQACVADGTIIASGPLKDTNLRSGFLIFKAENRQAVEARIADDPFAVEGLIVDLSIHEWDPLFGFFSGQSSGTLAGLDLTE